MDREQILRAAYSPRVSTDPLFVRDSIGVALFGAAQAQVLAARAGQPTLPASGIAPLVSGAPPPPPGAVPLAAAALDQPSQQPSGAIPSPLTAPLGEPLSPPSGQTEQPAQLAGLNPADIIGALPDTGPTIDDFTRNGTLPGFGDAALDPFGSALRRRLTVLLRSA